jgi:hypothetical protein
MPFKSPIDFVGAVATNAYSSSDDFLDFDVRLQSVGVDKTAILVDQPT